METNNTPNFICTIETRQLADFLIKKSAAKDYETVIAYADLDAAAGCDVRARPGVLQSAKRIALREAGADFGTVRTLGVKLLDSHEIVGVGESTVTHVRKATTRTLGRLARVDYSRLTDGDKMRHNANASFLGAMRLMTGSSARKRIEGAVSQAASKIPVADVLRLFHNGS